MPSFSVLSRIFFPILLTIFFLTGCSPKAQGLRTYEETVVAYKTGAKSNAAKVPAKRSSAASWVTPKGWFEEPGSALRLVSFYTTRNGDPMECTIVRLSGEAGGLDGNLRRWLGQCKVTPSFQELENYLKVVKPESLDGSTSLYFFDLTHFTKDPGRLSILAAAVRQGDDSYFFKLTGKGSSLALEKAAFLGLCRSFKPVSF